MTTTQREVPARHGLAPPGPWLRIARPGALVFMAFCIVTFVWGLLLFPRYGLANLDAIRPNDAWSDATLAAVMALVFFGVVGLLQGVFGRVTGMQQSPLAVVISTLAIAALFTPLRRRIQDWIDRRFFRQKYDAQQVLAQFTQTARDETDLDALTGELVRVTQEAMQPERVSVWLAPAGRGNGKAYNAQP